MNAPRLVSATAGNRRRSGRSRLASRSITLGTLAVSVALVASACSGTDSANGSSGSSSQTLTVGVSAGLIAPDPQTSSLATDSAILEQIYEGLTKENPKTGAIEPSLATSWSTSSDGMTWTFKLRKGVKFDDGKTLTSADVKYSLDRIIDPATKATLASDLASVQSVTTDGPDTVQIHLNQLDGILPTTLATEVWAAIVPANSGPTLASKPDGTGPFEFVSQVPKASVTLKRFSDYWDKGEPKVENLDFKVIPDPSAAIAALTSHQVDIINTVSMAQVSQLKKTKGINLVTFDSAWVDEFGMNTQRAPFNNVKVRQAISMAINRTAVAKAATLGLGKPAQTMVAVGPIKVTVEPLGYDPAKAKQLLAEAGYANGFSFSFAPCGGTAYPQMARAADEIASELKSIGVTATPTTIDSGVWGDQVINDHNYQAFICGLTTGSDPDSRTYRYFSSDGSYNFSQYNGGQKLDDLLQNAREITNQQKRTDDYDQAWQIITDDAPWVPLYQNPGLMATTDDVKGFQTSSDSDLILTNVTVG